MKQDPLVGTVLGAYRIQSMLGEGGMARVYKAFHERLQRDVAIKIIRPESAGEANFQRRFEQEAQLIARLQHRNIVAVYDFGESSDVAYLVMQYVAGGTLRDQLVGGQPLDPRRAALYALQMTRALQHAHQYGIVHRDVKPLNMLVSATNRNELLLSDFGLAKLFSNSLEIPITTNPSQIKDTSQSLSAIRGPMGTPRYMAPEQCLEKPVDARTDIYALGVVLFEMLTGRPPFQGETSALLYQHAYGMAPSAHTINPFLPDALVQITARALAKKPEERYQSAKEMGHALEQFLTPAVPVVQHAATPPLRRRRRISNYFTVAIVLVLAVLIQQLFGAGFIHLPAFLAPAQKSIILPGDSQTALCTPAQNAVQAQSFTELFQDNQRDWLIGDTNGVTSKIADNNYTLNLPNSANSYFLCPGATHVGTLPDNFSLTTQITQKSGGIAALYGIAFRLRREGDANNLSGYAFVINSQGNWAILKYDPRVKSGNTILASGGPNLSIIHKASVSNTLQVVVVGNKMTFKINESVLSANGDGQTDQTLSDASYTGGLFGILASGPNTSFTVTSVKLSV